MSKEDKNGKKKRDDKIKIPPVDCFFDTGYTANTFDKIRKLHKKVWFKCICNCCTCYTVDTKIAIEQIEKNREYQRQKQKLYYWMKNKDNESDKVPTTQPG